MTRDRVVWGVCVLLFFAGGIFFQAFPDFNFGWEAASAVGTISAVFLSLWLSGKSDRQAREREIVRVGLVAARVSPVVSRLEDLVSKLIGWAYFTNLDDEENPVSDARAYVQGFRRYVDQISREDLEILVNLSPSVASGLSRVVGEITSLIHMVDSESRDWRDIPRNEKLVFQKEWGEHLITANTILSVIVRPLQKTMDNFSPLPDWGQIYSEDDE